MKGLSELSYTANSEFIWIGPLVFFLSLFLPFIAGKKDTRKTLLYLWGASLLIGGIFALATYSGLPKSGMESMFTIFVFPIFGPRWGLITNCIISSLYLAFKKEKTNDEKGLLGIYISGLAACTIIILPFNTVVKQDFKKDDIFWRVVHERNISELPLEIYQKHVTKNRIDNKLIQILNSGENRENFSTELLHVFFKIGEDVSGCSNLDKELFNECLKKENNVYSTKDGTPFTSNSRIYAIIKNKNIPKSVLQKILDDPVHKKEFSVYLSMAQNPNSIIRNMLPTEEELISRLKDQGKVDSVILESKRTLARYSGDEALLLKLSKEADEKIIKNLFWNPSVPYKALIALAEDKNEHIYYPAKMEIYESPKTPLNILRDAYKNGDNRVHERLAKNTHLPEDLVDALFSNRKDVLVRRAVLVGLGNRRSPDIEKIKSFIRDMADDNFYQPHFPSIINREVGLELGSAKNFSYFLEKTGKFDDEIYEMLVHSSDKLKLNLTKYERTDYRVLKFLSKDSNPDIALAAKKSLDEIRDITGYQGL